MAKKLFCVFVFILIFHGSSCAQFLFADLPQDHPAYDSVYNVVAVYHVMSTYQDKTFRGEDEIDKYSFTKALVSSIKYLEKKTKMKFVSNISSFEVFYDISRDHWAYKYVDEALNRYRIIDGYTELSFRGSKPLTRTEFAVMLGRAFFLIEGSEKYSFDPYFYDVNRGNWAFKYVQKLVDAKIISGGGSFKGKETVSRYEAAVAIDSFITRSSIVFQAKLPSEIKTTIVYQGLPLNVELCWMGIHEDISQTDNWTGYGLGLGVRQPFKLFGQETMLDLKFSYGNYKMVYLDSSSFELLRENRILSRALFDFSESASAPLLFGLEYLVLDNSFSPATFLGLDVGGRTKFELPFGLAPEVMAVYAFPLSSTENVPSKYGAPNGRIFAEASFNLFLLGLRPQFIYSFEDLLIGKSNHSRLYNTFGFRFKV